MTAESAAALGYVGPNAEALAIRDRATCACGHLSISHASRLADGTETRTGRGMCGREDTRRNPCGCAEFTRPSPTLAALDFPTPAPACEWDTEHTQTPPAAYRAVKTCGCVSLICDVHAEVTRRAHNRAVQGIEPARCGTCDALPAALSILEPITQTEV